MASLPTLLHVRGVAIAAVVISGLVLLASMPTRHPSQGGVVFAGNETVAQTSESPLGGDIAFTHTQPAEESSGLYLATDADSVQQLLGEDGIYYLAVDWTNDNQLVFVAGPGSHLASLRVVDADGSNERVIADPSGGTVGDAVPSPDGAEVAFSRHYEDESASVFTVGVDGTDEQEVDLGDFDVPPTFACSLLSPLTATPVDWSPNGEELLIRVFKRGCEVEFSDLAVVSADGAVRGLNASGALRADWSPSGQFIAYETDHGLFVQPASGEPGEGLAERVEMGPGQAPDWSATGDLAFVRARVWEDISSYGAWRARAENLADAQPVVEPGLRVDVPQWSPGESHIAYLGLTETGSDLWVTTSEGAEPIRVQTLDGFVLDLSYAPDEPQP